MQRTILTGLLWTQLEDLKEEEQVAIKHAYTYVHPFEESQVFETFIEHNGKLGIPFGNQTKALELLPKGIQIDDQRVYDKLPTKISLTGLTLRDYQEASLEECKEFINGGGTTFNLSGLP